MLRSMNATFVDDAPQIDGLLSDEIWKSSNVVGDFIQSTPKPEVDGSQKTEVRFLYDNEAIYIGARMYEENPKDIYNFLTERDWFGNADFFIVVFNTYRDGINGEGFAVTPAGVQIDIKYSSDGESNSWDAVWESATSIDDKGWVAEIKIPYSALRFPESEEQLWGINFGREIRRNRERDWWNLVNPRIDGFLTQTGELKGIKNIKPPTRLFFFPYTSAILEHNSAQGGSESYSFNGGMDVKYGINDAFTLDMTLIPDFGQARFDNQVLNLTQFEVQFNENRQFFTEGVELFNKAGIFYSRRVGDRPLNFNAANNDLAINEVVEENPNQSRLINATKISGRTKGGLGIGVFNALENRTFAEIKNIESGKTRSLKTNPLTNYNMLVFDQVLRKNSFITFSNANTSREGIYDDANVSQLDFQLADKSNKYAIRGYAGMSHIESNSGVKSGSNWQAAFAKISGNFTFELSQEQISKDYDPNDLGFLNITNIRRSGFFAQYARYKPFSIFNFARHSFDVIYESLDQGGEFVNFAMNWSTVYSLKSFHAIGLNAGIEPIRTNDYFETRSFEQYYNFPTNYNFGGFFSSDYSRPFALDIRIQNRFFDEPGRRNFFYSIAPRFRPNDKLFFVIGHNKDKRRNEIGFVTNQNDSIIFGSRLVEEFESFINGSYIFNNRMALSLNLRHYWSTARYNRFNRVDPGNGDLLSTDYLEINENGTSSEDISFNAFNIDLGFNWRFAPGSEINVVWKNIIIDEGTPLDINYYQDLENTIKAPQINNFSIKVLYFIDYLSLKKKV